MNSTVPFVVTDDSQEDRLPLPIGLVLNRRYRIKKVLGQGAMGTVYACEQLDLECRLVAMKALHPEVSEDPIAIERFRDETETLYTITNSNVTQAYEYFVDNGIYAFTMEYVDGGDLRDSIDEGRVPTGLALIRLLYQIYNGVSAIHKTGIVHRDLKPENILLTKLGIPKVADFGISCWTRRTVKAEEGLIFGTLDYLSPEYLQTGHFDHRSDIFALGILSYEIITGKVPSRGCNLKESLREGLCRDNSLSADAVETVINLILRCLSEAPEDRFQSVETMKSWLNLIIPLPPRRKVSVSRFWSPGKKLEKGRLTSVSRGPVEE